MNPDLKRRDIRTAFAGDEFRILIVANKFQTGFDQPLLAAMYVDKRLAGVTAVQTLSRLNRTYPGKTQTFVLDFVNKDEEILAAFAPYYRTAELAGVSDPNIIHALQNKLDGERIYTEAEVDAFCAAYFDPKGTQKQLQARIAPAVDRFRVRLREAEESGDKAALDALGIFRKDLGSFVRAYEFLAQIFDYGDTDLEQRAVFYRHLQPWLKVENARTPIDLSAVELTHYRMQDLGQRAIKLEEERAEYKLPPLGEVGTASRAGSAAGAAGGDRPAGQRAVCRRRARGGHAGGGAPRLGADAAEPRPGAAGGEQQQGAVCDGRLPQGVYGHAGGCARRLPGGGGAGAGAGGDTGGV